MERDEWEQDVLDCAGCGVAIDLAADPNFAFGPRGALCFECAVSRGGEYDALHEKWTAPPDLSGVAQPAAEW